MRYSGGKNGSGVFQRLICMMPPHKVYVEMFLGSGAILRRKKPADLSLAYELDRATIREVAKHLPPEHFEPWNINSEWNGKDDLPGGGGSWSSKGYKDGQAKAKEVGIKRGVGSSGSSTKALGS